MKSECLLSAYQVIHIFYSISLNRLNTHADFKIRCQNIVVYYPHSHHSYQRNFFAQFLSLEFFTRCIRQWIFIKITVAHCIERYYNANQDILTKVSMMSFRLRNVLSNLEVLGHYQIFSREREQLLISNKDIQCIAYITCTVWQKLSLPVTYSSSYQT